jgi:hypothetical protein
VGQGLATKPSRKATTTYAACSDLFDIASSYNKQKKAVRGYEQLFVYLEQ